MSSELEPRGRIRSSRAAIYRTSRSRSKQKFAVSVECWIERFETRAIMCWWNRDTVEDEGQLSALFLSTKGLLFSPA